MLMLKLLTMQNHQKSVAFKSLVENGYEIKSGSQEKSEMIDQF